MTKFNDILVDSENKIITSCPDCGNQDYFYLIHSNKLLGHPTIHEGGEYYTQYCDSCEKPYLIEIQTELTCKIKTYKCDEKHE